MPITSKVEKKRNLTIFTLTGDLTLDEIIGALRSFWEGGELTLHTLWDTQHAVVKNLKSSDIENIACFIGQNRNRLGKRKDGKAAIVASTDLQYGLSRVLGTLYERENVPVRLHPFRSMDEAIRWLNQS
jgi:hypothetical protein